LGNNKLKPKFGQRQRLSILGRDVWVYQPSMTISSQPSAAIVVLHGSEDTALNIAAATGFEDLSEQPLDETFISVFPEMGTLRAEDWEYKADIVFFKALADTLVTSFGVKGEEVFVCGHSAGGSMALFLQNNMPNVFRAAAAVEAGVGHLPKWDLSSAGRPAMVIWNQNDPVLKEYGGEKLLSNTLSTLRRHDSSRLGPSFSLSIPLADHSSVKHAQKFMWGGGANSPPTLVISWESVQPSHHWVNGKSFPGAFDASGKIWDFFRSTRSWSSSDSGYGVEELSKNAMIQA
jgi:poly(3-hydroxybutyrate) depolymerase